MYGTIIVGVDASASAEVALDAALELARTTGARLHVVTVYRPLSAHEVAERRRGVRPGDQTVVDDAADARALLDKVGRRAADAGVDAQRYAELGEPGDVLVRMAGQLGADLVVVGSRGMTGVRRVLGSVPNHVTHHAPCSVLLVRTC